MANYKWNVKMLKSLSEEDIALLELVYRHRCVDEQLAHRYIYSSVAIHRNFTHNRLMELVRMHLLEPVSYGKKYPALFLTTLGVEALRNLKIGSHDDLFSDIRPAYDLKMKPQNINHQIRLNAFALEYQLAATGQLKYEYFDAKFMPRCSETMSPDGLLVFQNRLYLLEMDMGNERSSHLAVKWNNYRSFLTNRAEFYQNRKMTMLFILDGVKVTSQRRNTVLSSLSQYLLDAVDVEFEVFVDAPEILLDILTEQTLKGPGLCAAGDRARRALHALNGFSFSRAGFSTFLSSEYDSYIRKLDPERHVAVQDGKPQEFLLDYWMDGRVSVVHKIFFHNKTNFAFEQRMRRGISYMIVVPSEKWLSNVLAQCGARGMKDVYFTTAERLEKRSLPEALFQIDEVGALYHYLNCGLKERCFERRLS